MIDDGDCASWQMLLDQIDTMWVESIWLFTDRKKTERRCAQGRVEEGEEQTDEQTDRQRQNSLSGNTWSDSDMAELAAGHILSLRGKKPLIWTKYI